MTPCIEHFSATDPSPAVSAPDEAKLATQFATLTPDERARYDADAFFHGIVDTVFAMEREHPTAFTRPAIVRGKYGDDWEREIADLEAGRHPLLQPR